MSLIYALQDPDNPNSLAMRFRRRRARHVVELIAQASADARGCRILDLGGRSDYWRMFDRAMLEAAGVRITLVNFEITAGEDDPMFEMVEGDACRLPQYADHSFDLVHSNSVLEHVGDWPKMEAFAGEVRRLAPRYFVQTPYFWFPIEPHFSAPFFHWRPEQSRARALLKRRHGFCEVQGDVGGAMRAVQHARLLDKTQFRYLLPDARHIDERVAGLTKSLIAIRG
jgi:hypothetical protein